MSLNFDDSENIFYMFHYTLIFHFLSLVSVISDINIKHLKMLVMPTVKNRKYVSFDVNAFHALHFPLLKCLPIFRYFWEMKPSIYYFTKLHNDLEPSKHIAPLLTERH